MKIDFHSKLDNSFYLQPTNTIAKKLLGKIIVKKIKNDFVAGKIVEVEAYTQHSDEASHSYLGKSKRNLAMFEKPGTLYVYFIYGMYFCANIVTNTENIGDAVLIRAVEPIYNIPQIAKNRFNKTDISQKEFINLLNGPSKFCMGFEIDRKDNFTNLLSDDFFITENTEQEKFEIIETKRIGITKSKDLLRRFYIKGNKFISKP